MLKGETKTGFKFSISDDALDDWELLEQLAELDKGNTGVIVKVIPSLLGDKQAEKLKEHCREDGKVKITRMASELSEILKANEQTKNPLPRQSNQF